MLKEKRRSIIFAMSEESCLVCASDEGVFIDIEEKPAIKEKATNCGLEKVSTNGLSSKICHKCAFEIEQCNTFIETVKSANQNQDQQTDCCTLCSKNDNNDIFFDLTIHKANINDLVQRIQGLFAHELKNKDFDKQFICLSCRYFIDLLTDLKNLFNEIPSKLKTIVRNGLDLSDLPKTKTSVVNRKTTLIHSSNFELHTPSDTDSDFSSIMGNKKKVAKTKRPLVLTSHKKCEKCRKQVKCNTDLYRIYQTGKTICKQCWLKIDFDKVLKFKKTNKINDIETKVCSVLLKDVFKTIDEEKYMCKTDEKGRNDLKVGNYGDNEKRSNRNRNKVKSYSEESEDEESVVSEEEQEITTGKAEGKSTKSRRQRNIFEQTVQKSLQVSTKTRRQRKISEHSLQEVAQVSSRARRQRKTSEQSVTQSTESKVRPRRGRKESVQSEIEEHESTVLIRSSGSRKDSEQSLQDAEIKSKKETRKDLEQQESADSKNVRGSKRRKNSEQSIQEESDVDIDSDTAQISKKAKKSDRDLEKSRAKSKVDNLRETVPSRKRGRSSSVESAGSIRKSSRNVRKNHVRELEEIIEIDDEVQAFEAEKENESEKEEILLDSKRSRANDDENQFKKHTSNSSRETMPVSTFETPSKKDDQLSTTSEAVKEIDGTKVSISASPETKVTDTSESEEIDVLKSTDEETKCNDSLERENEEEKSLYSPNEKIAEGQANQENSVQDVSLKKNETSDENLIEYSPGKEVALNKDNESIDVDISESNKTTSGNESTSRKCNEKSKPIIEYSSDSEVKHVTAEDKVVQNYSDVEEKKAITDEDEDNPPSDSSNSSKSSTNKRSVLKSSQARKSKKSLGRKAFRKTSVKSKEMIQDSSDSEVEKDNSQKSSNSRALHKDNNVNIDKDDNVSESSKSSAASFIQSTSIKSNVDLSAIIKDFSDSDADDENKAPTNTIYTCNVCDMVCESKFIGLQHELTHMKSLKLSLEKIEVSKINKNSEESNSHTEERLENSDSSSDDAEDKNCEKMAVDDDNIENESADETVEIDDKYENVLAEHSIEKENENEKDNETAVLDKEAESDARDQSVELEDEPRGRRSSKRASKMIEEKSKERKSRDRKRTNESADFERNSATVESETDKISNEFLETAEENVSGLQENIEESSSAQVVPETTVICDDENEFSQSIENKVDRISDGTLEPHEEAENDTVYDEQDLERPVATSIVDIDDESSKEVVDVESEAARRTEESEVEITEIDDTDQEQNIETVDNNDCEQVDLTENDDVEILKPVNDVEIEEITDSIRNFQRDESTIDSITEINVASAEEPSVENCDENPGISKNKVVADEEEGNNTEEEEALAQESLEDLLQRKGLQVVDELAESVTDGDDDSERDVNISSEKENIPEKDHEESGIEIKISDAECTEILEFTGKTSNRQKDASVVGESQIIQDVDVVEEVVNDDDEVEEVQVESHGNCFEINNKVIGEVRAESSNSTDDIQNRLNLQIESISDDKTDLIQPCKDVAKNIRSSHDMPSLDPFGEDSDG